MESSERARPPVPRQASNSDACGLYDEVLLGPSSTSIRVLHLHGSNGDANEPLHGTLRCVNLAHDLEEPGFASLSYVCGLWSTPRDTITCDNHTVEITSNSYQALHALRSTLGSISIWVDSICINQGDEVEKSIQIPLMGDLYARARPAYIWPGVGNKATDRAMDCIKLASYLRVPPLGIPWSSNSSALSRGKDVGRFLMIAIRIWAFNHFFIAVFIRRRIDRRSQLSDFQALLQTDWLERAWTFQELILSPEPIIVCGTRHLEWKTWYQGLDYQNASPDHDRWAQENYEYAYWIRRHPRYLLPDYVVQPWRDLMVVWTAAPRPIGFCTKKNPKDSGNRDDD